MVEIASPRTAQVNFMMSDNVEITTVLRDQGEAVRALCRGRVCIPSSAMVIIMLGPWMRPDPIGRKK